MFHPAPSAVQHTRFEDAQALVTAALFVALGVGMYARAGLLTGGTAGLAFLVHYATDWRFGVVFFLINLPFIWFGWKMMGTAFTLKSLVAVALLSLFSELLPTVVRFDWLDPLYAAVMGGFLIGTGLLMLFRHHASLGGVNVLVLWLQQRYGWRAGAVQMGIDCLIVAGALALVEPGKVALSVLGAVALNLVVAVNHKPGRYLGV
jgi:uncharacterized membrane-anchored protein YitT (DUF2179 family)